MVVRGTESVQEGVLPHERRVAIEAIATLAYLKNDLYEHLLRPAGVPILAYQQIYHRRDALGRPLTKRAMAPLILDTVSQQRGQPSTTRRIVELAAGWTRMDLANDASAAHATILMARGFLSSVADEEAEQQRRQAAQAAAASAEQRRILESQSALLLAMYDDLSRSADPQRRGYLLQDLLPRTLALHGVPVAGSFTRNDGGEQVDGAFRLDGSHFLVECRWRSQPIDIRQVDGLLGQVQRSGPQALGLFLAINGWSANVVPLLKQNPDKRVLLMDGYDLRRVLADPLDLRALLQAKVAALNFRAEPYLSVRTFTQEMDSRRSQSHGPLL